MTGTGAANWTVPGGPHTAAARRPCGLRKVCNRASTPGTSGRNCSPWRLSTASKLASSKASSSASPLDELEVVEPLSSCPLAAEREHLGGDVGADDVARTLVRHKQLQSAQGSDMPS